ncbi:complement component receptor 1-like protein isoform 2-T2 [Macrochelys suwanniensis]
MVLVTAVVSPGHCHPLWLLGFVVLLLPGACGLCGALPSLSHAIPSDTNRTEGFPINTQVTYRCLDGFVKIPGKSDTVECLSNSQWSNMEEFCGRSCLAPPRLKSAVLSDEDLRKNYYPVGTTVSYVCRPAYEKTELSPVITCLENLTWVEAPEFCLGKSCGVPKSPEHGRPVDTTNNRFGAKVYILCDDGYQVSGQPFIQCLLNGDQVEWSKLPICQLITCSPPPNITNGMHNGSNMEIFDYNSSVTYKCDHNFSLTGEASIQCTTKDNINGVWNGSAPECKGQCGAPPRLRHAVPRDNRTEGFPINTEVTYRCLDGFVKIPGKSDTVVCLSNSEWSTIGECCGPSCPAPPRIRSAFLSKEDEMKNYHPSGTTVSYVCRPGYERTELIPVMTCLENLTWSEAPEFCRGKSCGVPKGPEHGRAVGDVTNDLYGAKVNIICDEGFRLRGWTFIQCLLKGDQVEWSQPPTCQASCGAPPRLKSAALNKEDEMKNYHPSGTTVSYVCRPGYERTELRPVMTCLENLTWSEAPEFCRGKSCGVPKGPEHGRAVDVTNDLYGAKVNIICDDGFRLRGRTFIQCLLKGDQVEWSPLPTCQEITCSPPPNITSGMHNGSNVERFAYNSSVTYKCHHNFTLTGEASIRCTTKDNINGVWNGSAPECKVILTQDKPTTVPPEGAEVAGTSSGSVLSTTGKSAEPEGEVIITQDKPTTVPPKGAEVAGTSSGPGIDTHIIIGIIGIIIGIGIGIGISKGRSIAISMGKSIAIGIGICIGNKKWQKEKALNKKWQKKKGSYNVNPDSTEHDFQMNGTKSNFIFKV